jgi:hypothetical protein
MPEKRRRSRGRRHSRRSDRPSGRRKISEPDAGAIGSVSRLF